MSGGEARFGRDGGDVSCKKDCSLGLSGDSSSPIATTMPPVERDGGPLVAGEAVEAEDGTGFLFTVSLGTVM